VGLALPAPFVKTDQGLDSDGVQRNFEALSLNAAVSFPAGGVIPFAGATAPVGYLLCNGASVSTTDYAKLFAVIAYTYGGAGASFNLPDLRSRVPIGAGTGTGLTARTLGGAVGAETTALVATDVPAHGHNNTFATSAEATDHTHTGSTLVTGNQSANHTHTGSATGTFASSNTSATTVTTTGGATRINAITYTTPSITTLGVSADHNHAITGSTGGRSASHTHAITGSVSNSAASTTSPAVIPPALGLNYIIKT